MAKARDFYGDTGFNDDLIITDKIERACAEIFATYGDIVKVNRKSLRKYGRNEAVGTTAGGFDITSFNTGSYQNETHLLTNGIDSISSSAIADTNVPVYLEGMVIDANNELTFISQVVNTDGSSGRTRVAIPTPMCECTRARAVATDEIWIYENTALTNGKPTDVTKIHNQVVQRSRTSLKAGTSVARNNYFILLGQWATLGRASGSAAADISIFQSTIGDPVLGNSFFERVVWSISPGSPPEGPDIDYAIIQPNTRIVPRAQSSSGTLDIKSGFYGIFADIVARRDSAGRMVPFA